MKLTAQYNQDSRTIMLYLPDDAIIPADGSITTVKLANDAITSAKIAANAVMTDHLTDSLVTTAKIAGLAVDENKLSDFAVTSGKVAQGAITTDSDRDGICQGQTTGGAGNLTINGAYSSGGTATLNPVARISVYSAGNLGALTFTVYGTNSLGQAQNEAVTGPNNTTAYTTANFKTVTQVAVSGAVATAVEVGAIYSKIDFAAIETAHIKEAAIGGAAIGTAAIGSANIADAAIINTKLDRASANKIQIVTADIADANITTAKIADANITGAKIGSLAVDTLNIAGNAVTLPLSYSFNDMSVINGTQQLATLTVSSAAVAQNLAITFFSLVADNGSGITYGFDLWVSAYSSGVPLEDYAVFTSNSQRHTRSFVKLYQLSANTSTTVTLKWHTSGEGPYIYNGVLMVAGIKR